MKNFIDKAHRYLLTKFIEHVDKRLITNAVKELKKEIPADILEKMFLPILHSTLKSLRTNVMYGVDQPAQKTTQGEQIMINMMLKITTKVLRNIWSLHNIVGIQPLAGPVGLVFALRYHANENNSIELRIESQTVQAMSRKLNAIWTIEAMQDMQTVQGIEIESEIVEVLSSEIFNDVANEVIAMTRKLATVGRYDEFETPENELIFGLNKAASRIGFTTRRGAGNVIITTPVGIAMLSTKLPKDKGLEFKVTNHDMYGSAFAEVGSIMSNGKEQYKVFVSTAGALVNPDKVEFIVGFKGKSGECDAGLIYCPYMPVMKTGICVDPVTFQPSIQLLTRYGMVTGGYDEEEKNYYRLVTVKLPDQL